MKHKYQKYQTRYQKFAIETGLTPRTAAGLLRNDVKTIEQLSRLSDDDILDMRNFGKGTLDEIRSHFPEPLKPILPSLNDIGDWNGE